MLVFKTVTSQWSGAKAAELYTSTVGPALRKRYPKAKSFLALEDNDPTGNLSKAGIAAKAKQKIEVLKIPKRSPDLNVMDYFIWAEIEKRMRAQERMMKSGKCETRAEFEKRLDATAKGLPAALINKAIGNMHIRCQRLYEAEGGLFEEGGRSKRRILTASTATKKHARSR